MDRSESGRAGGYGRGYVKIHYIRIFKCPREIYNDYTPVRKILLTNASVLLGTGLWDPCSPGTSHLGKDSLV